MSGEAPFPPTAPVHLGRGPRLASLRAPLGALARELGRPEPRQHGDLLELLLDPAHGHPRASARLVLDLDEVPAADLGLLERVLDQRPAWRLELVGGDPGGSVGRALLNGGRARWFPWPLDVLQLRALCGAPEPSPAIVPEPSPADGHPSSDGPSRSRTAVDLGAPRPDTGRPRPRGALAEIEAILGAERGGSSSRATSSTTRPPAADPFDSAPAEAFRAAPDPLSVPGRAPATDAPGATAAETDLDLAPSLDLPPEPGGFDGPAGSPTGTGWEDRQAADDLPEEEGLFDLGPVSLDPEELAFLLEDPPDLGPEAAPGSPFLPEPASPELEDARAPRWYRDQVADLADMTQRLELALLRTREALDEQGAEEDVREVEDLQQDVLRLGQFTRTLGFIAAPPARGSQVLDLSVLIEELLAGLPTQLEATPRLLFRGSPGCHVRSEKSLLGLAFDALLVVAARAAGADEVLRTAVEPGPHEHVVRITFPPGALTGRSPSELLLPYALHRLLPGVGPNAVPAAGGILTGQGGTLSLERGDDGQLAFVVTLPAEAGHPQAAPSTSGPAFGPFG